MLPSMTCSPTPRVRMSWLPAGDGREEREPHEISRRGPRDQPVRLHVVDGNDRDVVRRAFLRGDDADAQAHGGRTRGGDGVEPDAPVTFGRSRDDVVDGRLVRLLREVRDDASPRGVDGVLRRLGLAEERPSPVTTAAPVSSHDVSMPRMRVSASTATV